MAVTSRSRKRPSRNLNPHNIVFDNPEQKKRFQVHRKWKLTPTRYICEHTLTDLGLKIEVDRMFHVLGMLEFMSLEAPTYEHITLEFLSTLEIQLEKWWINTTRYYYNTLRFLLFNNYCELSVNELAGILRLPLYGPGAVPDGFCLKDFWTAITGRTDYTSKGAKASGIQNTCFRYAQKGLAYTLFGRCDRMGVADQWEFLFMYSMAQNQAIDVAGFAADYLGRVGQADSGGISVGGLITHIAEHFGYHAVFLEYTLVAGKTKIDMVALVQQCMISMAHNYYSVLIHKRFIIVLLDPDKVSLTNYANWLYVCADPDTEEGYKVENLGVGEQVAGEEINEGEEPQENFVPPPYEPFHQGEGHHP